MSLVKNTLILIIFCSSSVAMVAQSTHRHLRDGDKAYEQEAYDVAEESYRKAIEKSPNAKGTFNLGNSVYNQDRFEEAAQHYQQSINSISDDVDRAEAFYNLGNAQLKNGQLEEAIESYKEAVRINPEDDDIRQNLYIAKLLRKEEQQQEQQEDQQQNQEQQNNEEQNQDQQQQEGQSQEEQQQASEADIDNEGGESPVPEDAQELSKEDAEKLLQVIENEEKSVQEKLRKVSGSKKKPKKDW